jgi:nucleoside-diphosphate kinase
VFCILNKFSIFEKFYVNQWVDSEIQPLKPKKEDNYMEKTLVILKPSAMGRGISGEIIDRFIKKGLIIAGMKMMQLSDAIVEEHYAHLIDRPFFNRIKNSMQCLPVIVICLKGIDAVQVVRNMTGATNGRNAAPGTIRGDYSMGIENVVHASDSIENAAIEINRFFKPEEIFDYTPAAMNLIYADDEL